MLKMPHVLHEKLQEEKELLGYSGQKSELRLLEQVGLHRKMDLEIGEDGGFPSTVLQFHCRNLKSWV
jgi:hypothetical protein